MILKQDFASSCRTRLVLGTWRVSAEIHLYWRYFELYIIIPLVLDMKSDQVPVNSIFGSSLQI